MLERAGDVALFTLGPDARSYRYGGGGRLCVLAHLTHDSSQFSEAEQIRRIKVWIVARLCVYSNRSSRLAGRVAQAIYTIAYKSDCPRLTG